MFDHFENIGTMLRSIALLPNPESSYFHSLSPEAKNFLAESNARTIKFICIMTASAETQAARLQIEAFDTSFLENAPFNVFLARLVSQKSLMSGPDLAGDSAPRKGTTLSAQARPPRRPLKEITCFGCRKSGHYQRDCPDAPGAAAAADESAPGLSAGELAALRHLLVDGRGRVGVSAVAVAGSAAAAHRDPLATHRDFIADDDSDDDTA
jgi:hypothetical protein